MKINLRRGLVRLTAGAVAVWFVFWTFAYVVDPDTVLKPELAFAARVTAWHVVVPCLAAAFPLAGWIGAGFRRDEFGGNG